MKILEISANQPQQCANLQERQHLSQPAAVEHPKATVQSVVFSIYQCEQLYIWLYEYTNAAAVIWYKQAFFSSNVTSNTKKLVY
jgi:hypothetical protein